MPSQPEKQTIARRILPNISKVKATRQATDLGQLLQYNMKNIFLEKLYTK